MIQNLLEFGAQGQGKQHAVSVQLQLDPFAHRTAGTKYSSTQLYRLKYREFVYKILEHLE